MIIILAIAGRAEAAFYTGAQILANCESEAGTERSLCAAYLGGIADATELWVGAGLLPKLICMPADASMDRLEASFEAYANENPEELDQVASATVIAAFMAAFPCL